MTPRCLRRCVAALSCGKMRRCCAIRLFGRVMDPPSSVNPASGTESSTGPNVFNERMRKKM